MTILSEEEKDKQLQEMKEAYNEVIKNKSYTADFFIKSNTKRLESYEESYGKRYLFVWDEGKHGEQSLLLAICKECCKVFYDAFPLSLVDNKLAHECAIDQQDQSVSKWYIYECDEMPLYKIPKVLGAMESWPTVIHHKFIERLREVKDIPYEKLKSMSEYSIPWKMDKEKALVRIQNKGPIPIYDEQEIIDRYQEAYNIALSRCEKKETE